MRPPLPRPPRALALLLATQLVACFGKADDDDDDDGGSEETSDSGWTDGGGTDGGGGDGGGGGGGGACPDLLPLDDVGAVKVYQYTEASSVDGTYTTTWTGPDTVDGTAVYGVRTEMEYWGDGYEAWYTYDAWYRCDGDGAWLVASEGEGETVTSAGATPFATSTVYTTEPLVMPASVAVGDSWTYDYASVTTDSSGTVTEYSDRLTYEVDRSDSVTVPAGTYSTLFIRPVEAGETYGSHYADGVGFVQNRDAELVDER